MPTMQAVLIKDGKGPVDNLYIGDTEKPVPKEGEVLVKVGLPCDQMKPDDKRFVDRCFWPQSLGFEPA
jgi:hypothetical protein